VTRRRRRLLQFVASALAVHAVRGLAQSAQAVRRIGYLAALKAPTPQSPIWLRDALKPLGYEEGRNLVLERAWGDGSLDRLPALAQILVQRGVEVIVAHSNSAITAALGATRTIPIVMVYGIAPVEAGFVKSLAQPGGNVTGNAFHTSATAEKAFDLILEAFPKTKRVTMLWFNPDRPGYHSYTTVLSALAQRRGIAFDFVGVKRPDEIPAALQRIEATQPHLVLVANDVLFEGYDKQVAGFAAERKIPTIGTVSVWLEAGGLFYFGPDEMEPIVRTPRYVASLLRGAKPADLPVEQPSAYHLKVNADTARALGYTIPDSLLLRISS
jgi:putative tryptophan/tyrosine transport system substrate-binding protein